MSTCRAAGAGEHLDHDLVAVDVEALDLDVAELDDLRDLVTQGNSITVS